jgi:hypothetical protein
MKQRNLLVSALTFLLVISCAETPKAANLLAAEIQEIKTEFAPDKRVALFDISAEQKGDAIVLKGESNLPDAVNTFM